MTTIQSAYFIPGWESFVGTLLRVSKTTRFYPDNEDVIGAGYLNAGDWVIVVSEANEEVGAVDADNEVKTSGEVRVLSRCGLVYMDGSGLERLRARPQPQGAK